MDWAGLMRVGLSELGLAPAAFWALTPAELIVMAGHDRRAAPMGRAAFEALVAAHPDQTGGQDDR